MKRKLLFLCLLATSLLNIDAKVKLQPMFSDNMVLQQKTNTPIWGEARAGKKVTVLPSWNGKLYTTQANAAGQWKITVETPGAGGPYEITISDGQKFTLRNVMIGEVWLCTGQSNMEMPMRGWDTPMNADEIANSGKYNNIRMLQVDEVLSTTPKNTLTVKSGGWMTCSPETVRDFSATGFFFGKNIEERLNVPVGLIMTCWGGTPVESWISGECLRQVDAFKARIDSMSANELVRERQYQSYLVNYDSWFLDQIKREHSADSQGRVILAQPDYDDSSWFSAQAPAILEGNGLEEFDGIVWLRKTIDIPASWARKDLQLNLAQVDDNDVTYFNGECVGRSIGYGVQRSYVVPGRLVKAGKAVITVSSLDSGGGAGFAGDALKMNIGPKGTQQPLSLASEWRVKATTNLSDMTQMPPDLRLTQNSPTVLFNSMIAPLIPYPVRGAIWYQGEANADRAYQYRELLPLMIRDWRERWGTDFSFYIMQLANYQARHAKPVECAWAELREAQLLTAQNVINCGMAVNIDIGNPANIHPTSKSEVGRRLAILALNKTYGEDVEYSGPKYQGYQLESGQIRIKFAHTDDMKAKDGGVLRGFAIAGIDHEFHWADAHVEGNSVVVSSSEVNYPIAVRYAWDDNPDCNLINGSGLPASPFRTDDWQGITYGRK